MRKAIGKENVEVFITCQTYERETSVLQAWELHKKGELLRLVDTSLGDDFNVEEACRFLKIGLLCTQDQPKLRPSMSAVVKMLLGEMHLIDEISKPGLMSQFMDSKDGRGQEDNAKMKIEFSTASPGLGMPDTSSSSGNITSSIATMTFNSIYDRTK